MQTIQDRLMWSVRPQLHCLFSVKHVFYSIRLPACLPAELKKSEAKICFIQNYECAKCYVTIYQTDQRLFIECFTYT